MADGPVDWNENCPPHLVRAVEAIRGEFENTEEEWRDETQGLCYTALHPEARGTPASEEYIQMLAKRLGVAAPDGLGRSSSPISGQTPSRTLYKCFRIYKQMVGLALRRAFKKLLMIGIANSNLLGGDPIGWASQQVQYLIDHFRHNPIIESWVRDGCDQQEFDPAANPMEVVSWTAWRAPRFTLMEPALAAPYEPSRVGERADETTTGRVLAEYRLRFVLHLEGALKNAAGKAAVELAKQAEVGPVTPTGRDLLRAKGTTQKRSTHPRNLCYEGAANILRTTPKMDRQTFCIQMDRKAAQHPKHPRYQPPKSWNVRSFSEQYKKRSNTVSAFMNRVRDMLRAEQNDAL